MNVRQQTCSLIQFFFQQKKFEKKKKMTKKRTFILLVQMRFNTYKLKTKKQAK